MRLALLAALAITALPVAARADDTPPGQTEPAPADDGCAGHGAAWDHHRPRLAVGLASSHLRLDGDRDGHQHGVVIRAALRHGVELEVELARAEIGADDVRTVGGSVIKMFGARHLAPYVIAGGGGGKVERADGTEPRLHYGEAGAGVMLRKHHLALGVDVRAGVRKLHDSDADAATRMTTTPATDDDADHYVRCRFTAMLYF